MQGRATSLVALACVVVLLAVLSWLDRTRGGPATMLSRCNLALARAEAPAADVLMIGSSRSGVAFDPVTISAALRRETGREVSVDRVAIGNITLRLSDALLESYLHRRGAARVIVIEATVMTPRTVRRLEPVAGGKPSEHYLLARDQNLMSFAQLISQPAVAMPYTEAEAAATLWHFRMRSAVSRAGALIYQFATAPREGWSVDRCGKTDFTREAVWSPEFSFSYGDYTLDGPLEESIARLREAVEKGADARSLQDWQREQPQGQVYPYDFGADYRQGEMIYLRNMVTQARAAGAQVLVLPMPLYGYAIDPGDIEQLRSSLPEDVGIVDIYGEIGTDFSRYWYDDAHIEKHPTGALTTALMARRLLPLIAGGGARD